MADRLHASFTTADGLHGIAAWSVANIDDVAAVEADIGKVARAVRPGSTEFANGIVALVASFPPVNREQYNVGDEIGLYPFLADGAQPFTVQEILPDDDAGQTLKLRVQSTQPGTFWELLPGENSLASPPATFSGQVFALGDGVRVSTQKWWVLHDHTDGSPVWRELVTREYGYVEPAPGGGGSEEPAPRRITQIAAEVSEGATALHVGALSFTAGEVLAVGSLVFLASTGTGSVSLELVEEATSAIVATWNTTSPTITAVSLGAEVTLSGGIYGLRLHGDAETSVAVFRGLDLQVRTA